MISLEDMRNQTDVNYLTPSDYLLWASEWNFWRRTRYGRALGLLLFIPGMILGLICVGLINPLWVAVGYMLTGKFHQNNTNTEYR